MRSKAIERLQRIQELFPGEEAAQPGFAAALHFGGNRTGSMRAAPAAAALSGAPAAAPVAAQPAAQPVTVVEAADVSSLAKVAEITRKLYHQGNAEGVLKTAANEIGAQWRSARCIAALRKPGLPPSSVQEYHAEGLMPVSAAALVSLVETLQDLAVARGTVTITDAVNAPELLSVTRGNRRVADRVVDGAAAGRGQRPDRRADSDAECAAARGRNRKCS